MSPTPGMYQQGCVLMVYSKQAFLQDVPTPHDLLDGTPSFLDFMGNRNNRFTNPEAAAKNQLLTVIFSTPLSSELRKTVPEQHLRQSSLSVLRRGSPGSGRSSSPPEPLGLTMSCSGDP
ncbi:hypothetical protein LSH36_151g00015 [Paralvinella palmiformis]|uniref:Uncharacterized protein n=1 Tax=Paralvinella palmiformis TaxID=53620 RepID=A0AAD9JUA3_9ANNE|nr:hypothetical protein LSH36_151g00015 [Paralvinella palmiformis]